MGFDVFNTKTSNRKIDHDPQKEDLHGNFDKLIWDFGCFMRHKSTMIIARRSYNRGNVLFGVVRAAYRAEMIRNNIFMIISDSGWCYLFCDKPIIHKHDPDSRHQQNHEKPRV